MKGEDQREAGGVGHSLMLYCILYTAGRWIKSSTSARRTETCCRREMGESCVKCNGRRCDWLHELQLEKHT